jgi:hypothetical protein
MDPDFRVADDPGVEVSAFLRKALFGEAARTD